MALNGTTLGDAIADCIIAENAPADMKAKIKAQWEDIGQAVVKHFVDNLEVKIPSGSVIVAVIGGSGAPAVGTPNPEPLATDVQ